MNGIVAQFDTGASAFFSWRRYIWLRGFSWPYNVCSMLANLEVDIIVGFGFVDVVLPVDSVKTFFLELNDLLAVTPSL